MYESADCPGNRVLDSETVADAAVVTNSGEVIATIGAT
jgi:hypothetical protein